MGSLILFIFCSLNFYKDAASIYVQVQHCKTVYQCRTANTWSHCLEILGGYYLLNQINFCDDLCVNSDSFPCIAVINKDNDNINNIFLNLNKPNDNSNNNNFLDNNTVNLETTSNYYTESLIFNDYTTSALKETENMYTTHFDETTIEEKNTSVILDTTDEVFPTISISDHNNSTLNNVDSNLEVTTNVLNNNQDIELELYTTNSDSFYSFTQEQEATDKTIAANADNNELFTTSESTSNIIEITQTTQLEYTDSYIENSMITNKEYNTSVDIITTPVNLIKRKKRKFPPLCLKHEIFDGPSCSQYFECVNTFLWFFKPSLKTCPDGQHYGIDEHKCIPISISTCAD